MRCEAETRDNRRRCGGGGSRRLIELLPHTPLSLSLELQRSSSSLFRLSTQIPAVLLYPLRAACVSRIKHCLARASRLSKKSLIRKTQREERDALRLPDYKTLTLAPVRAANEKKILAMGDRERENRTRVSEWLCYFCKHHKATFDVISFLVFLLSVCTPMMQKGTLCSHLGRQTKLATLRSGSYSKCKRPFDASLDADSGDELWSSRQSYDFAAKNKQTEMFQFIALSILS